MSCVEYDNQLVPGCLPSVSIPVLVLKRRSSAPRPSEMLAARPSVSDQSKPASIIEFKGVKTSHFKESKTAPWDRENFGSLEQVECPQSEPANNDIHSLAQRGWSRRRIAKELGVNRETVGRYLRPSKPAISIAGTGAGRRSPEPRSEDYYLEPTGFMQAHHARFRKPFASPVVAKGPGGIRLGQHLML